MIAPPIHRITASSKRGRQLLAELGRIERGPGLSPEQKAWNARVESERQVKKKK